MKGQFSGEFVQTQAIIKGYRIKETQFRFYTGNVPLELLTKNGLDTPPNFALMSTRRRSEYLAGRLCAIKAIKDIFPHAQSFGLLPLADRTVNWPSGITGSLSHNDSIAIACVADNNIYQNIGIDVETVFTNEMSNYITGEIFSPYEKDNIKYENILSLSDAILVTLIFSVKESLFKALYPDVETVLNFHSAIAISIDKNQVGLYLRHNVSCHWLKGNIVNINYSLVGSLIYTWLAVVR